MREIYVQAGQPMELAVAEEGHLVEYLLDDGSHAAERIYLGKVERVVPGMKAAFVDIGQEKNGFLPLEERSQSLTLPRLQAGMNVLVQVKKEAQGSKGAFLTRDVTLCGELVILMPLNRYVGVSGRVEDEETREAMRALGLCITEGRFGLILRHSAPDAGEAAIREETASLLDRWEAIRKAAPTAHAPSVIDDARDLLDSVLDDYRPRGIDRFIVNDPNLARRLSGIAPVTLAGDDMMALAGLTKQRDKALRRQVWLRSGGTLVIDRCEAMTVIDVNTAKFTGQRDLEETVLRLNLEACEEIARQVRLRNLSGIILIDMIDMESETHRQRVLEELKRCFALDRVKTVIHGFTSLGLIEMTRKRSRLPLMDEWTAPCPACGGEGRVLRKEERHG